MNHPATRDPLGSRSPGCCYHTWNPQVYPPCRICLRPVLTLQQPCPLRAGLVAPSLLHHPPHHHSHLGSLAQTPVQEAQGSTEPVLGTPCHDPHHRHQQSRSAETTPTPFNRFDWRSSSATTSTNPRYHTHPPPRSAASRSPPIVRHHHHHHQHSHRHESQDDSSIATGQRASSTSFLTRPLIPPALEPTHRWIGEETKRSLPSHVYKYYLAHTKEYRRQSRKVIISARTKNRVNGKFNFKQSNALSNLILACLQRKLRLWSHINSHDDGRSAMAFAQKQTVLRRYLRGFPCVGGEQAPKEN